LKDYIDWVAGPALDIWSRIGRDAATGRFHERLDGSGRPIAIPHRAMVQARQIYVFAHAAALGWSADGGALADAAMAQLVRDFVEEADGVASVAFSIDPATRAIVSPVRDSYAHAFVLIAVARLYALTGAAWLIGLAERMTGFVDRHLWDPVHGGVVDAVPALTVGKRQNPQMHLLEAYLALDAVAPGRGFGERADRLVGLFATRLFGPHGALVEHFADDWSHHPDPARARRVEPGHHYEWIWLLDRHRRASGTDVAGWQAALRRVADEAGHDTRGLIHDELDLDRAVVRPSHRLWPHTEAIKAAAVRHREGDPHAAAFAGRMAALLGAHFIDQPFAGGWIDHVSPDLAPLVDYVPASSLYHLFLAAAEADAAFVQAR
jgi:mannose/cellobiose epimerase-like protein (N-acyl-D-glucosamine 2-epimerase family)